MADLSLRYLLFGSDVTASKVFRDVGESAKKASEKIDGASEHTSGSMGTLAKIAGGALLGVAGAAVGVGVASLEMADTFESAQTRLEGAIVNSGGKFDELKGHIDATNKTLEGFGFTNADTESALATLTNATHDPAKAMSQMSLAADIARGRNIDLATATGILTKVNTGHVALLGKLGINTKDATGKTISQAEALKRLSAMYGGDAKRSAETFGGKQAQLRAELQDTGAKIGMALMPILLKFANFVINDVIPGIKKLAQVFTQDVKPALITAYNYFKQNIIPVIKELWAKAQPILQQLWQVFKSVFTAIQAVVQTFIGIVMDMWDRFGGQLLGHLKTAWSAIQQELRGVFQVISGIFDLFRDLLTGKWGKLWGDVERIFAGVWNMIVGQLRFVINEISTVIGAGMAAISLIWSKIWGGIEAIVGGVVSWIKQHWQLIVAILAGPIGVAAYEIKQHWDTIKQDANKVIQFFAGMPAAIGRAVTGMWNPIKNGFRDILNTVIGWWDDFIGHLHLHPHTIVPGTPFSNPIKSPDVDLGAGLYVSKLARGGIVKARPGGILANIGEGRYDEAVIPLTGGSLGGEVHFHIHTNAVLTNGTDAAKLLDTVVAEATARGWRPTGRGLVTA